MKKRHICRSIVILGAMGITLMSGCSDNKATEAGNNTLTTPTIAGYEQTYDNAAASGWMSDGSTGMPNDISSGYRSAYGSGFMNSEEYNSISEEGFQTVAEHPLSTFSIDVDTASYSNIRRMIKRGQEIPADAVRIEELLNYFNYDYEEPKDGAPFAVTTELSDCPWNPESQLLLVGIQAEQIDFDKRPMSNLVFLLDVSGSMYDEDKLPLVQKSFSLLTEELTENDRVSIVTYAGYEQVVLDGARGDQKGIIREALESLIAGGSTAGEAGINMAYEMAEKYYIPGGNNRVILATDGDLNVGLSSEQELTDLISEKRKSGVHLSVLGFGTGNIKDNKMEALADHGDGNYHYIDGLTEAKKVLVEEMGGTLITVAKDVKIQVEFNPSELSEYRLLGYENRALADEDFTDDTVDAGEIGSGHRVTALYELKQSGSHSAIPALKYQPEQSVPSDPLAGSTDNGKAGAGSIQTNPAFDGELLTVSIRYKAPNGSDSSLYQVPVKRESYQRKLPDNLRFASAVAEFGMLLRDSEYKGTASYEQVVTLLNGMPNRKMDDYKDEFKQLVLTYMDKR